MQKNKITIISRNDSREGDIQKKRRVFNLQGQKIVYENKFQTKENNIKFTQGVHVVNNLCELRNQRLIKTTYIYFEDKIIKIQDQIFLQSQLKDVKVDDSNNQIKKPTIYKIIQANHNVIQSSQSSQYEQRRRKDLKNIVKNIVKIFLNWLQRNKQFDSCKSAMQKYLKNHKYNNSLINDMSLNNQINTVFMAFLLNEAQQKIHDSRIHDKKSHMEAIKKYYKIFKDNQSPGQDDSYQQNSQNNDNSHQRNKQQKSGKMRRAQKQSKIKVQDQNIQNPYYLSHMNSDQRMYEQNQDQHQNQNQNDILQQNQNQGNNKNQQQQNNNSSQDKKSSSQDKKSSILGAKSNKNSWNNNDKDYNQYNGSSGSNSLFFSSSGQEQ